jgi:hypothetical protein
VLLTDRIREADDPSFDLSVFLGCNLELLYRILKSFTQLRRLLLQVLGCGAGADLISELGEIGLPLD